MSNQITATLKIVNTDNSDQYLVRPDFPLFLSCPPRPGYGYSIDLTGNGSEWFNVDEILSRPLTFIYKVNEDRFAMLEELLISQENGWIAHRKEA